MWNRRQRQSRTIKIVFIIFFIIIIYPCIIKATPSDADTVTTFDIRNYATFSDALSAIGTHNGILTVSSEQVISHSMIIPANIQLKVTETGSFNILSHMTMKVQGHFEGPPRKIFLGDGEVLFCGREIQRVYAQWWGARTDDSVDDTAAMQLAVNSLSLSGGELYIPDGTYIIGQLFIKSNITVTGNGSNTILKQKRGSKFLVSTDPTEGGSKRNDLNTNNIKFVNLTFRGTVEEDGFSEPVMLMNIKASSNIFVEKCAFIGFRGDGIYIGEIGGKPRHNSNITISECVFDGVNRDNRNGVSVIDCDGVVIEKNIFKNCTRPKMPGPIDFEPNRNSNIIRNVRVTNNRFQNNGGVGVIIITIEPRVRELETPLENISIIGNFIDSNGEANGIFVGQLQFSETNTRPNNVVISNNTVKNTNRPFWIVGVKNVRITDNVFEESEAGPAISYYPKPTVSINVMDVEIAGNTFKNLSKRDGWGIMILNAFNITFKNNIFDNIGKADGSDGSALYFRTSTPGTDYVTIEGNIFKGRNTKTPVQTEINFKTEPEHNRITNNTFLDSDLVLLPAGN